MEWGLQELKMYISFDYSNYLIFLLAIPILVFFYFFSLKNLKGKSLNFANFSAIAKVKGIDLYSKNLIPLFINILFIFLLVFSLSGIRLHKIMDVSSFSFIIAIDNSQSMEAEDLLPNRISVAKKNAIEFINALPFNSNVGIVSFAGSTYIEQGITNDKQELKKAINRIQADNFGGTDIYEAILTSINLLKGEENKAIILLSDGQINVGDVNLIIELLREEEIVVNTIGLGTLEGGNTSYGISKLDIDTLKAISYNSQGKFFNVSTDIEIKNSFGEMMNITKKMGSIKLSNYLIIIALILFVLKEFLVNINKISW